VQDAVSIAILEFLAWSHNRSARQLTIDPGQIVIEQLVDSGVDLAHGDSHAFFIDDGERAAQDEFPTWANPHDLALDQLREFIATMPEGMLAMKPVGGGSTLIDAAAHCARTEGFYARQLRPGVSISANDASAVQSLQQAHAALQQVVCDVSPDLRVRRDSAGPHQFEEWSVRKVMRRSIWHLRYHTWEMRNAVSRIWLAD
jgi:hypothetical protein